jgi:hypothetical protein
VNNKFCKTLTIFEGCDGSGKSTQAKKFAEKTGALYVHFPALPRVTKNLARMYVEAMLPALLGYQDVVFDRSWLSEPPYSIAFREGRERLGVADYRMLERLALRCGAVVVLCDPGWDIVKANYMSRKHLEMLNDESQLKVVYDIYKNMEKSTSLSVTKFDYYNDAQFVRFSNYCHLLHTQTAGNIYAPYILVGESFAERKDNDSFYQWPFASFSNEGCSQWLTERLHAHGVPESDLLWVNADQDLSFILGLTPKHVFALGNEAYSELYRNKIPATVIPHPQYWKRFHSRETYPLLNHI